MVLVVHSAVVDWASAEEVEVTAWVTVTGKLLVWVRAGQSVTVAAQEVTVYTVVDQMVLVVHSAVADCASAEEVEDAAWVTVTGTLLVVDSAVGDWASTEDVDDAAVTVTGKLLV